MHLFISPHPDDVPLSCGALVSDLCHTQGEAVTVLTVMSGDVPDELPQTPIVQDLHQRWKIGHNPSIERRAEDKRACEILGAEVIHTPIMDCVYRTLDGQALYPDEASLWGDVHTDDPAFSQLDAWFGTFDRTPDTLYLPMAIGNHVDHKLVLAWGLQFSQQYPQMTVKFYEDYPYSESSKHVESTLNSFPVSIQPITHVCSEQAIEVKLKSIEAYDSQISTFWHSVDEMRQKIRTFMTRSGTATENLWIMDKSNNF